MPSYLDGPSDPLGQDPEPGLGDPYGQAAYDPFGTSAETVGEPSTFGVEEPTYGAQAYPFGDDAAGTDSYSTDSYSTDSYGASAAPTAFDAPTTPAPATIRVSVAVVEPQPAIRDRLMMQLGDGGTPFGSIEELAARLTGSVPVVVILGPSCANPGDLALAERLVAAHDNLGAILVVDELTTTLLQHALRSGVKDVLTLHGDTGQITQAVQRVAVALDSGPRRGAAAPQDVTPGDAVVSDGPLGQVITIFSTKGGAGKSVMATNLAITLAQRSNQPVCLVDGDLQFGDVAVMLKLTPHHTIVDAVTAIDRMDSAMLESLLVIHEASGLRVLPAPLEPAFADQVGAAEMVRIVEQLRTFCSFVVVDTPAYFNDVVLGLVEISDKVVLIAGMDIPNIKNVKIGLQTLRLLNTPMEKLLLVLNRSNSKVKLDIGEVERTLQVKADALIPSDVLIPQSVNKGVPVVLHAPKSPVAKAIREMADIFLQAPAPAKRK